VLLVVRDSDAETWQFLQAFDTQSLPLKALTVTVPGVVSALNVGLEVAIGDVISITDDDAAPHPDWLERIEAHFLADAQVGGVGGRDWMYLNNQLQDASVHPGASKIVGKVQWFGRTIGNHHIGEGSARSVEFLKGANMSYRKAAIANLRFNEHLKGAGAQTHNDLAFSLAVHQSGWKLIYDPLVAVDHYLSKRFDEDQRSASFNYVACVNASHNETLVLLQHFSPIQRFVFLTWSLLIGTRSNLGLISLLRFLPKDKELALQKFLASLQGQWQGWKAWQQKSRQTIISR